MAFFSRPQSSAAIKIVNPNTQAPAQEEEPRQSTATPTRKDTTQRQCRNVLIYGSCKYQGKGCMYQHPSSSTDGESSEAAIQRPESPTAVGSPLSARAVNAPVFVPKAVAAASPPRSPTPTDEPYEYHYHGEIMDSMGEYYDEQQQPYDMPQFYPTHPNLFIREPLNYHLYTQTVPPAFQRNPSADNHYLPPSQELRQILQTRSEVARGGPAPGSSLGLPDEVQGYHTLVPLEATVADRRKFGSWFSTLYRGVKESDGIPYALRRVENFRLMHQAAFTAIEQWSRIRHPGIITVAEAFTTRAFGDSSLVVAYEYHPGSRTLYDLHFNKIVGSNGPHNNPYMQTTPRSSTPTPVSERTLWSYIVQIASAIRRVHEAGMAVRMVDASKILVTGKNRLRISSCGLIDVLMYDHATRMTASGGQDAQQLLNQQQLDDLSMFGRLIIGLCVGATNAATGGQFQKSLEIMARGYSQDVKAAALFLISKNNPHRNITHFFDIISTRLVKEMDDALYASDCLENELTGELENARLVRLLCKFGFINERPEFARDPRWSETGDRYLIKLFRDYVFHQLDEQGNPVTNMSHVLTCLNKLDAGSEEKVMLVARDEQSCLVVSYREIKSCVEAAFSDLSRAAPGRNGKPW